MLCWTRVLMTSRTCACDWPLASASVRMAPSAFSMVCWAISVALADGLPSCAMPLQLRSNLAQNRLQHFRLLVGHRFDAVEGNFVGLDDRLDVLAAPFDDRLQID